MWSFNIQTKYFCGVYCYKKSVLFILSGTTFENDIAILELSKDARFSEYVIPACLPNNQVESIYRIQDLLNLSLFL